VEGALALLERVDKLVDETPPETGEMRFGNKAFRTWHAKLVEVCHHHHHSERERLSLSLCVCVCVRSRAVLHAC
jgi:hypothetical protein